MGTAICGVSRGQVGLEYPSQVEMGVMVPAVAQMVIVGMQVLPRVGVPLVMVVTEDQTKSGPMAALVDAATVPVVVAVVAEAPQEVGMLVVAAEGPVDGDLPRWLQRAPKVETVWLE